MSEGRRQRNGREEKRREEKGNSAVILLLLLHLVTIPILHLASLQIHIHIHIHVYYLVRINQLDSLIQRKLCRLRSLHSLRCINESSC